MKSSVVNIDVVSEYAFEKLETGAVKSAMLPILFGGDRASCCDEGVILQGAQGEILAMASIAPEGEMREGTPTIVGLYVFPEFRRRGYGRQILEATLLRCLERGFRRVYFETLGSRRMMRIIEKLPPDLQDVLDVRHSEDMDMTDMFMAAEEVKKEES